MVEIETFASTHNSSKTSTDTILQKIINLLMTELGIKDLWGDLHLSDRDNNFYFPRHNIYTRMDYFIFYIFLFLRETDRHRMHSCDTGYIDLSDHASLSSTVHINNYPGRTLWRLNIYSK